MAEFNPIRDLMPVDSSRESVDRSSEQIKVIETKLTETKNGVSNLLNIIKTKNSFLDKDLSKIKSLNLRLKRTIPRIPILPGTAGTQFGELAEAQRKSRQGGGGGLPFGLLAALPLLGLLNRKPKTEPKITYKNKNVKKAFQTLDTAKNITIGAGSVVGIRQSGKGLFRTIKKKLMSGDGKVKMLGIGELLKSIFRGNKNPIKKKIVKPDTPKANFFEKMFFQNKEPNKFNIKVNPNRVDLSKTREQIRLENIRRTLNEAKTVIPNRKPIVNRENFFNRGNVENAQFTGPGNLIQKLKQRTVQMIKNMRGETDSDILKLQKKFDELLKSGNIKELRKYFTMEEIQNYYKSGKLKIPEGFKKKYSPRGRNLKEEFGNPFGFIEESKFIRQNRINKNPPKDKAFNPNSLSNNDIAMLNTDTGITNTVIILTGTA